MAVRSWVSVFGLSIALALPLCAQHAQSSQQQTDTQDLPSAPQPQPSAGQQKQESQRPSPPPKPPASEPGPYGPTGPSATSAPPRTAPPEGSGSSTSKQDRVDITPPANDAKDHPNAGLDNSDVGEFHPFDPHRAAKDVEVGDFYFKQHNYRAAISRYREALLYKPNDALATYSLAEALDKAGNFKEAAQNYQAYLKILPNGPKASDARKALERLHAKPVAATQPANTATVAKPPKD